MAVKKDIGIGIIGLGVGKAALVVNDSPDSRMRVVAVCDRDARKAEAFAERSGILHYTTDYVDMIMMPGVDVVAVYSPDALHYEHTMSALMADRHVLCSMPFATNLEQALAIAREVEVRRLKLMVGQPLRWHKGFLAARSLCENGDLGELRVLEAHYVDDLRDVRTRTPWRWQMPQDLIHGGLSRPLDLLRWMGGEIEEVYAVAQQSGLDPRFQPPDNFLLTLQFRSGAVGRLMGLFGCVRPPMPSLGLSLFGTRGSFVNDRFTLDRVPGRPSLLLEREKPFSEEDPESSLYRDIRHFEDCLLNIETPMTNHWDAVHTVAICAAVQESLDAGKPVAVRAIPFAEAPDTNSPTVEE